MDLANFDGYPVALRTTLSVEVCHQRLQQEFYDTNHRWRHAATDKRLRGWQTGDEFVIVHSANWTQTGMRSATCRLRITPGVTDTLISGRYAYRNNTTVPIGPTWGVVVGIVLSLIGLTQIAQDRAMLWMLACGIAILAISIILIRDSGKKELARERDYIARYLSHVLEAAPRQPLDAQGNATYRG